MCKIHKTCDICDFFNVCELPRLDNDEIMDYIKKVVIERIRFGFDKEGGNENSGRVEEFIDEDRPQGVSGL